MHAKRALENPILIPEKSRSWEADSVFNASPAHDGKAVHLVYRAMGTEQDVDGKRLSVSTIGYTKSKDGVHFGERRQLIAPEHDWEKYGCEDPRITKLNGKYYIFYTALSTYPFSADGIKVGAAVTKDLKNFEKHAVTPFNAKAMALFPGKAGGKLTAILAVNTDRPPVSIAIAQFNREEDMWSKEYWDAWYKDLEEHTLYLQRGTMDHVEVGAAPLHTKDGWLLLYSEIKNYHSGRPLFTIQAVLLDKDNPYRVVGRTEQPLLMPEEDYELYGKVPNIVFPSGAMIRGNTLRIYYGGADTVVCTATTALDALIKDMKRVMRHQTEFRRYQKNPILFPNPEHPWEAKAVFNPGAIELNGRVHLLYRAMSHDNTSVFGYAHSRNGYDFDERLTRPVYEPKEPFEQKLVPGGNSGCEDARLTKIGSTIYMLYTAYEGTHPPRGAMTSISVSDFIAHRWKWKKAQLITAPDQDNKDIAIFPRKIGGEYVFLHRPHSKEMWIDFVDTLEFGDGKWLKGQMLMGPRPESWDSAKVGVSSPPIETPGGWLVLYHGVSEQSKKYRTGAVLLDLEDPRRITGRSHDPIFEPMMPYEIEGQVRNVVFPCGHAVLGDTLFIYYGGADTVIGVATCSLSRLVKSLRA